MPCDAVASSTFVEGVLEVVKSLREALDHLEAALVDVLDGNEPPPSRRLAIVTVKEADDASR